jgi:sensor domain CHASE-containing protein
MTTGKPPNSSVQFFSLSDYFLRFIFLLLEIIQSLTDELKALKQENEQLKSKLLLREAQLFGVKSEKGTSKKSASSSDSCQTSSCR